MFKYIVTAAIWIGIIFLFAYVIAHLAANCEVFTNDASYYYAVILRCTR